MRSRRTNALVRAATRAARIGFALLATACAMNAGELDGRELDPFAGDDKGDGSAFFDANEVVVELPEDGAGSVRVTADGTRVKYTDAEVSVWSRRAAGNVRRVRLDDGDSVAGMRSFLLAKSRDPLHDEAFLLSRVARAAGACVPRARPVRVFSGNRDLGPHVLVEHVGDRFLDRCFGDSQSAIARAPEELADEHTFHERLAASGTNIGAPSVWNVLDVEQAANLLAAARALGLERVDLALVDVGDEGRHALVPEIASRAVELDEIGRAIEDVHTFRAMYALALHDAVTCLSDRGCADSPDRVDTAEALARLETELDAPDGSLSYPPFAREDGSVVARFRNRAAGVFASAVTLRVFRDPTASGGRVDTLELALEYDEAQDAWRADVELAGAVRYAFAITDQDGAVHEVRDPTDRTARTADAASAIDLDALDELVPIRTVALDVHEPSGLDMANGHLWVMGDEAGKIVEIDAWTGARRDSVSLGVHGVEAVAIDPVTLDFLVADEDRGMILRYDAEGEPIDRSRFSWADDPSAGGLEGLTVRSEDGHLLFAKERSPTRIAELDMDGELVRRERVSFAADISALAWSPDDGYLYALSDQDRMLYRLNDAFEVVAFWMLDVDKPEGLAIADGYVYVVSDATSELSVLSLNRSRFSP